MGTPVEEGFELTPVVATEPWWGGMAACPSCGQNLGVPARDGTERCDTCQHEWSHHANVVDWRGPDDSGDERRLPAEWLTARTSRGPRRAAFLAKRGLWNVFKLAGLPLRELFARRLAGFHRRSLIDRQLAEHWRRHYLRGLHLPPGAVIFEYSYRKVEKAGFAGLLGYRIVIQDIRPHAWWNRSPHVWFHIVAPRARRLPLQSAVVDLVFTDGVIFDMDADALDAYFAECLRVLKPGGHLLVWGGNSRSRSRAMSEIRWHGRIHSLETVASSADRAGFVPLDVSFEGYAPPLFPAVVNTLRQALGPWPFKTYDFDSWLARCQRPEKRAYWLLRVRRQAMSVEARADG